MSFHPPKFLMTFLVIDSKFGNLVQILHFTLKASPNLSCAKELIFSPTHITQSFTKISFPQKFGKNFFHPKITKNLFSPKMDMVSISASFFHGMMGWN